MSTVLLDAAGRRRSPATKRISALADRRGTRAVAIPPIRRSREIVAVMRQAGTTPHGLGMRGLIVVLWRAGLRIHEALALTEADLDARRGAVIVRRGKAAVAARSAWLQDASRVRSSCVGHLTSCSPRS